MRPAVLWFGIVSAVSAFGFQPGYAGPGACRQCHPAIAASYARTGMGRSFYRPGPDSTPELLGRQEFRHEASAQSFVMYRRDGRFYQRRYQTLPDGREINLVEKEVHYVLGSGNHVRTYLHRNAAGELVELPVAWYAEKGGYWAMNPGYDRPDHMDFRRRIDRECFFCHNAYPGTQTAVDADARELALKGRVPEGIDCQRCHGPGAAHVSSAQAGESIDRLRKSIVNPARLSRARQLEVCYQCHLESTSRSLPYAIRRYGREFFSYKPGEPLEDYIFHFDFAPGTGHDDDFEISHSAYRLMKSSCFRKSGSLTCTTCHNPHEAPRGTEATVHYVRVCQSCHKPAHAPGDCVRCHMPKRRTDDVVHAVMTDHYIQRRKPDRDLLAPRAEVHETARTAYQGEVVPLYPAGPDEFYLAVAQVANGSNLAKGIVRLRKAIEGARPEQAGFYLALADAYRRANRPAESIPYYQAALRRNPRSSEARRNYAAALSGTGRGAEAVKTLEAVTRPDAAVLNALGSAYLGWNRLDEAIATLRLAATLDPDLPETFVNLGTALSRKGDSAGAIAALRAAIVASPGSAPAHNDLAVVLEASGDFAQARDHFAAALRIQPDYAAAHYNYGRALARRGNSREAEIELEAALEAEPTLAEAAVSLGRLFEQRGDRDRAEAQYRRALDIRPGLAVAHFNLGLLLMRLGKPEAREQFERVLASDPGDEEAHLYLGRMLLAAGERAAALLHLRKAAASSRPEVRSAAASALRDTR